MAITRFSYASLKVTNLSAAVRHYTNVVGLRLVSKTARQAYLQAADNQDHHCLILNYRKRAGLDHVGFKIGEKSDLKDASKAAKAWGLSVKTIPAGKIKAQGHGISIELPSKHTMVLFYHMDKIGYEAGMENPDPVRAQNRRGTKVTHLDHTLLGTEHMDETVNFLREVLDFDLTEKVVDPDGNAVASFLTCGNTMHDLALGPGPDGCFHHMAFGLETRGDVIEGVDILKQTNTRALQYGISRHGIAGVTTVYFHDPSGNRNEFFNGAYTVPGVPNQVSPVIWTPDQFARGAFYYETDIPDDFFAEVS
jgi:catechol 2,3-dioxygenase